MSDIPLHELRPKKHRTRTEDFGLALSPDSATMSKLKTAATVAAQRNRHYERYERYTGVVEQEEEQRLLDNEGYESPITVRSILNLVFVTNHICSLLLVRHLKRLHSITRISQERYLSTPQVLYMFIRRRRSSLIWLNREGPVAVSP